ncbi:hypothetical protein A3770_02p10770 [Chloropicon primus]|uniref:Uncharacterized protein n=1 Tax=Chloropicon primus TaxID=1764295 RepID=A0A5B8MDQ5_9CHLO|nr:hypothetical protein A3770_02p10770 [Chloropicon primus]|eukprot:QDZ18559.1 hypothetical protein A3770_02p10770 [Chloropicon primus]
MRLTFWNTTTGGARRVKEKARPGVFLRHATIEEGECVSSLTRLSRLEPSPKWRVEAAEEEREEGETVAIMKTAGLVRNLSRRVQKAKRKRKGSRFSLMESRESNSSLKGLMDLRKNLSVVSFAGVESDNGGLLGKPSGRKQKRKEVQDASSYSFDNTPSGSTGPESSFGTKLQVLLQHHDTELQDLKRKQKDELQSLLYRANEDHGDTMRSDPMDVAENDAASHSPTGSSLVPAADADRNDDPLLAGEAPVEEARTPEQPQLLNTRKTPRRTGNGRNWHGYGRAASKPWWMV